MLTIRYTQEAHKQIDEIISNQSIYDQYGHFTQQFVNWNYEFHHYVNVGTITKQKLSNHGLYTIGSIGKLVYNYFSINDTEVFQILEFRFSKLPYTQQTRQTPYKIVGDAGYGYKVVQSAFNGKHSILTPQKKYLTKFVFDNIIGFHHSSNAYNTIYAIGFINDRAYAIYKNGNIQVLSYTKDQYLNKKHKYYESVNKRTEIILKESQLRRLIQESIKKILNII
jgi:hypothetical protein